MKMSRRTAVIAGSIATLAVAGTLVAGPAFAKGKAIRNNQISNAQDFGGPGMMGRHGHGMDDGDMRMPNGVARGQMLHSEGVIAQTDSTGKVSFVTVRQQRGTVTEASDTSISVKSDDGYTAIWPISASTRVIRNGVEAKASTFTITDVIEVRGTVTGNTVTTNDVHNHAPRMAPMQGVTPSATSSGKPA